MNTTAYYTAQFCPRAGWCVARPMPGFAAGAWTSVTGCADQRTAERLAGHMNAERDAQQAAERAASALLLGGAFA